MATKTTHTPEPWTLAREISRAVLSRGSGDDEYACGQIIGMDNEDMQVVEAAPELLAAAKLAQTIRYHQIALESALAVIHTRGRTTTVESVEVARINAKDARRGITEANAAIDAAIAHAEVK